MSPGFTPFPSAEFPSDNPSLHEGVTWLLLEVSGLPRAVARPRSSRAHEAKAKPDAYDAFVLALIAVSLEAGATVAAAHVPALLGHEPLVYDSLRPDIRTGLVRAGVLDAASDSLAPSASFTATASAWRHVLRGETNDLSACGTTTLDRWGADLLGALGVNRDGVLDVRRELRRRGVAAFGMLNAA